LPSSEKAAPVGELVQVGRVGRPHGLDGSFVVEDASEAPERFVRGATLLVGGAARRVTGSKRARGRPVIRLDGPVERGAALCVPRSALPPPGPDAYYVFDLVGLAVEEEGGRSLGRVAAVEAGVANDVLVLGSGAALPLVDACIRAVDLEHGRILVAPGFADPI
jgi:16S rRNA processing protein RimM